MRISTEMANMDEGKRLEWENNSCFQSLYSHVYDAINICENEELLDELYSEYLDYTDSTLCLNVPQCYAVTANKNGLFYVDGVEHKVNKYGVAFAKKGCRLTTNDVLREKISTSDDCGFIQYDIMPSTSSGLKTLEYNEERTKFWDSMAHDGNKCSLTVTFFTKSVSDRISVTYGYSMEVKIKNQQRKPHTYRDHHTGCWYGYINLKYEKPFWGGYQVTEYKSFDKTYSKGAPVNYSNTEDLCIGIGFELKTISIHHFEMKASNNELGSYEVYINYNE